MSQYSHPSQISPQVSIGLGPYGYEQLLFSFSGGLVSGIPSGVPVYNQAFQVNIAPAASATKSLFQLGPTAISGGAAAGTYLGINAATAFAGDFHDYQQNSVKVWQVTSIASAVNGVQVKLAATGNAPSIAPIGSDTNINLALTGKGTGFVLVNGAGYSQVAKSTNYTASALDTVILCTASSAYQITLPQGAAYAGKVYEVEKDGGANAITVYGATGNICGGASIALASGAIHGVRVISDGTQYWQLGLY